jgi:transcriptional regulator with XRE-family HTH domain
MTQQGLATAVGCSRQTIVLLEQGRYSPSLTREDGLMMQIEAQRPHVAPF